MVDWIMKTKIDAKQVAHGLMRYNEWRRDKSVPTEIEQPKPKEIGVLIDQAVELAQRIEQVKLLSELNGPHQSASGILKILDGGL